MRAPIAGGVPVEQVIATQTKRIISGTVGSAASNAFIDRYDMNPYMAMGIGIGISGITYSGLETIGNIEYVNGFGAKPVEAAGDVKEVKEGSVDKKDSGFKYASELGKMPSEDVIHYDGYWKWKEVEGTLEYSNGSIYDGWYKADGRMNYPPNDGAIPGTEEIITLGENNVLTVGRYGESGERSAYVTQTGVDSSRLALPPNTDPSTYIEYKILKSIPDVERAVVAPWVGDKGLGIQYKLPKPIKWYIKHGYLTEKGG